MKCPNCNAELLSDSYQNKSCSNCHYLFPEEIHDKFSFYYELKNKLNNLSSIQKNFNEELADFQNQTNHFEEIIIKDLEKLPLETEKIFVKSSTHTPSSSQEDGKREKKQEGGIGKEETSSKEKDDFIRYVPPEKLSKNVPVKNQINWEVLFGFNGFLIMGVISIIVGVAFFIRKAFVSGLLGPVGKVSVIYLGAIISLAIGNFFRKSKYPDFGLALVGMAVALLYYATYAGFQTYEVFNQYIAFSLMILITSFAVFLAVIDNNKWLAVMGLIGGFSTPIMLNTGTEQNLTLFIYITILNVGLLTIALYKRWNLLNNLGFVFTYLIFVSAFKPEEQYWLSTIFLNIFFFIYSLVPFAYHILGKENEKVQNTWIIFINSFVALGLNYELMSRNKFSIEMLSIITLLYALNFTLMAAYLFKKEKQNDPSFIFVIGSAALFLIITIPIIFSKEVITIFWFTEAVILLWISSRLKGKRLIYGSYLVLIIALSKFFLIDYSDTFNLKDDFYIQPAYTYLIFARYITSIFLIGSFFTFVAMLKNIHLEFGTEHKIYLKGFSILSIISLFMILNVETSAFCYDYLPDGRFIAVSILWAFFAISLMFYGFRSNDPIIRKLAIGLFFATLAKVFFFDISKMGASYKFVSFIVLGLVLILASYLYRRFKDELIEIVKSEEKE